MGRDDGYHNTSPGEGGRMRDLKRLGDSKNTVEKAWATEGERLLKYGHKVYARLDRGEDYVQCVEDGIGVAPLDRKDLALRAHSVSQECALHGRQI